MSDYTKIVDFAAKDALITGNPAKLVKGTEIGAELDAISTAIATKYDAADIGVIIQAYDADLTTWAGVTPGTGVATALAVNLGSAGAVASLGTAETFTAQQSFTGTTATAPAIAGASDPNTGVFFPAADTVAVSTGGAERMRIDSSGNLTLTKAGADLDVHLTTTGGSGRDWVLRSDNDGRFIIRNETANQGVFEIDAAGKSMFNLAVDVGNELKVVQPYGLGYGTGAGGTVTQDTSKATGVTLNKPCGQITMHNASLAANTDVQFVLTNSTITADDRLVIHPDDATNGYFYSVTCYYVVNNVAYINVRNTSAAPRSDAIVLGFAIIKGVTS